MLDVRTTFLLVLLGLLATVSTASGCSGGVEGPLLTSKPQLLDRGGMDALVQGTVTVEGDCLLLVQSDFPDIGYPVVWPAGTRWQVDPHAVVLDDGTVVAVGEAVVGGGGYLQPSVLEGSSGQAVADAAAACVGETGEVAFFNLGSEVTPATSAP